MGGINTSGANLVLTQGTFDSGNYSSFKDEDNNEREAQPNPKETQQQSTILEETLVEQSRNTAVDALKSPAEVVQSIPEQMVASPVITTPSETRYRNTKPID